MIQIQPNIFNLYFFSNIFLFSIPKAIQNFDIINLEFKTTLFLKTRKLIK